MNASVRKPYRPAEGEPYMNPRQIGYFRAVLLAQQRELEFTTRDSLARLQASGAQEADPIDQGVLATERELLCQNRLRSQRLLARVNLALERIADGSYGFCEETGERIGLRRLLIRPEANLSVEAQELLEHRQRLGRVNGLAASTA